MTDRIRAILIAGPTASGKSALAVKLAQRLGGAVVNADSMQVYRDLRIITARPTVEEESEAPHRLFGHVDACENHSVGRWLAEIGPVLEDLSGRGVVPIVTGGTGLYFRALTEGLSAIPPVPEDVRAAVRAASDGVPPEELHRDLAARDPQTAATLRPTDRQRIVRALEIFTATGRSLVSFHGGREGRVLDPQDCVRVFLAPEREGVYARIDSRFESMMSLGALEEVSALARRQLDPALPCMRAHGVPWLIRAIEGEMALPEAIERAKLDTRHYAKRQFTWFRHQAEGWTWATPEEALDRILTAWTGD
ncbi:tRNA (adenosine(37)-N6)-dimethylallyltransferase MiaA [uncultured Alsobacter sp.]|uniref:tRNA (adenosine(37)-N6)-dimethylallyltransferase MiaA n=1 Tax=uncultured Alsobacter sp. TaxID=1748258 RepID=UPI0025E04A8A|nr:tRNA (adenosine(37)-N6)-dimethylallyltransferase MiaA [uncultured Alsobacter sp.]